MHSDRSEAVTRLYHDLAPLRGLWTGFEVDLAGIGVSCLDDLRERSADELLQAYCRQTERPLDFALRPYFEAVVRFARSGQACPAWKIMREEAVREQERILASALA